VDRPEASVITLGPQACGTRTESASREWLCADGLGGFAMGTVAGLRTRRYHGLLVVAGEHPGDRRLGLAALDPVLAVGDARIRLATDEWAGGIVDPTGYEHLVSFALVDGVPRWRFQVGPVLLEREVACLHRAAGVAVVHRMLAGPAPVRLELMALCTWRDAHGERLADGAPNVEATADGFVFEGAYRVAGAGYAAGGTWYRGARYREEAARGLPAVEDLWAAGTFVVDLAAGDEHAVVAWAPPSAPAPAAGRAVVDAARSRARAVAAAAGATDAASRRLAHAADLHVVQVGGEPAVVAGYPWFGEWSRDTLTSYEGLFLCCGRADEGRRLLERLAGTLSEGMLPNTADAGDAAWNSVDGALWFVHAVARHVAVTGDDDLGAALAPALADVAAWYARGTRNGIRAGDDGLLRQGADGLAMTWMDARIDGRPVTPRAGCAVEVQALWVNALAGIAGLREAAGGDASDLRALRDRARDALQARFAGADGHLADVVGSPSGDDRRLRPNGLLAVSLPGVRLGAAGHVEACRDALLTPLGLRSLDPADPAYHGRHRGSQVERDAAYHQGTVWPWLLGPYVEAALATGLRCDGVLDAVVDHVADAGLGSISETADGDAPHGPTGCPYQAWSVAEIIRARQLLGGTA
jgi:predicted glycogen debranching enzyme